MNVANIIFKKQRFGDRHFVVICLAIFLIVVPSASNRLITVHHYVAALAHPPVKRFHQKTLFAGKKFFQFLSFGQEVFGIDRLMGNWKFFGYFEKLNIQPVFVGQ